LRIAVLSANDPDDRRVTSGTPFHMCRALEALGHTLVPLGPVTPPAVAWRRIRHRISRTLLQRRWPYEHAPAIAHAYAREFQERLRAAGPVDLLFAPFASAELSEFDTTLPVLYASDATIPLLTDYHPGFTGLSASYLAAAQSLERRALARATILTYPSEWAAESAHSAYGVPVSRIRVAPFGPNLDRIPTRDEVQAAKQHPSNRVLFIGTNWRDKGGAIAVRAVERLRARGLPLTLTVCGAVPPASDRRDWVEVVSHLEQNRAADRARLRALLLDARVLVLPTRNDCYGIVFAEAAACGTPSVATRTGGVPAALVDGVTGTLVALDSDPDRFASAIADAIAALLDDPEGYARHSASARVHHETQQNWEQWARTVLAPFG
jgi:glycosyltransferase involved in cell wall biosynthesis